MQIGSVMIDDDLIEQAMKSTGLDSQSDVIEQGLRLLIAHHAQQNLRALRGKLSWDGDLAQLRDHSHGENI